MKEGTEVEHLSPPQVGFCEPADQDRGEGADPYEAQVHRCSQVVPIAQLHRAEDHHIADDAKKGEPLAELHEKNADDSLELFAGLPPCVAVPDGSPVPLMGGFGEPSLVLVLATRWQPLRLVSCHHALWVVRSAGLGRYEFCSVGGIRTGIGTGALADDTLTEAPRNGIPQVTVNALEGELTIELRPPSVFSTFKVSSFCVALLCGVRPMATFIPVK